MPQRQTVEAATDPLEEFQLDLGRAARIEKDIISKLDAARALSTVLEEQRQKHLLQAAAGDETAMAALEEIRRQSHANAATSADLESALQIINVRIAGCKARLKDARIASIQSEQAVLRARQDNHWQSIEDLCAQIRAEFDAAKSRAAAEGELEFKLRDLVCDPGRDPMLDQHAAGYIMSIPRTAIKAAIEKLERECR